MTPEQMREAAAKIARHCGYRDIAKAIESIPLTAPEPTMKDRMAGAVFAHTGYLCSQPTVGKAILEAMREPTETMVMAAYRDCRTIDFKSVWRFMIDAALAEK